MVARSVLRHGILTDDRKSHVSGIVDQAVKRIKDRYGLKLPHPDHPEIDASVTSGNYTKTNSTGPTDKDGTVAIE